MLRVLARPVKSHNPMFDVVERPNKTNKVDWPFLPYPKGGQTALPYEQLYQVHPDVQPKERNPGS